MVGRLVDGLAPPVVVELVELRRPKPKDREATLEGTPWLSRHDVYLANRAVLAALPTGAVVVEDVVADFALEPHADASSAKATREIVAKRTEFVRRVVSGCGSVTRIS
jgi:hypothetical protein